jgi:hypothetical protein
MDSHIQFIVVILCIFFAWLLWSFRGRSILSFFKTATGKGVLKGIVVVLGVSVFVTLASGCSGRYLNDASFYAGMDYTKNYSPQCEIAPPDQHTTSNVGFKLNLYESKDDRLNTNVKYTHHSCAFSRDREQYDAI